MKDDFLALTFIKHHACWRSAGTGSSGFISGGLFLEDVAQDPLVLVTSDLQITLSDGLLPSSHPGNPCLRCLVLNRYHARKTSVIFLRRVAAGLLSLLSSFTDTNIAVIRPGPPLPPQQLSGSAVRREFQHNIWISVGDPLRMALPHAASVGGLLLRACRTRGADASAHILSSGWSQRKPFDINLSGVDYGNFSLTNSWLQLWSDLTFSCL